jgi:tryptophanyl-tRNA synthetase
MRIVSGIQSSGPLHLGNYYGAVRQFIDLQVQGEALYFVANLHALTSVRDGRLARELARETAVALVALGVDPSGAILFRQSDIPEILELYWILGTLVPLSHLERAHGYKDKITRGMRPDFGLFAYPVLMAADILLYGADVVPVGRDQIQHIEFARDWATTFNATYGPILKLPEARVQAATAVVPGIDGQKMSKSYDNTIDLFGHGAEIEKRIATIKTDSTPVDAPKPIESSPLYELLKLMLPEPDFREVDRTWREGGKGYGEYKKILLDGFHAAFDAARARHAELSRDPGEVERILAQGAARAREIAAPIIGRVREAVGL